MTIHKTASRATLGALALSVGLSSALYSPASSAAGAVAANQVIGQAACTGTLYNPITNTDWNYAFPINWGGHSLQNPPWMYMPPVCMCPSHLVPSLKVPGIGLTYWEPNMIMEIQREPGCLSTLGGVKVLSAFDALRAGGNETRTGDSFSRMQVHMYRYPVFQVLSLFVSTACMNPSGVNLLDMTEINPVWNMGGGWQAALTPWSVLTSTPAAQAACAVEAAVQAVRGYPIPAMEWCAGSWGSASTMGGDLPQTNSNWSSNGLTAFKHLKMWAFVGGVWTTIGPLAKCFSYPSPLLDKAQFRYQQIGPWPIFGQRMRIGDLPPYYGAVMTNVAHRDSTDVLMWQGMQCCIRF